jgi:hypothetical protein
MEVPQRRWRVYLTITGSKEDQKFNLKKGESN